MANVDIEGRPHGNPIHDYVVEDHADHESASFASQREAIAWARNHGHAPPRRARAAPQ